MRKKWLILSSIIILNCILFISCIEHNKTSNQIKIDDNIRLQVENDNFQFYSYNKDKECLDDLLKTLEENYIRISKNLNTTLNEKVVVEIYPDIDSFHKSIGQPTAPSWIVGTGWENKIKMVSPLNPGEHNNYDTLTQVLIHEFTHILISNINSDLNNIPIWLNEGLATYEAKQINANGIEFIKKSIENNSTPLLSEMTYDNFAEVGGYMFSYTVIEYLANNYGFDKIVLLIKNPKDLEIILGIDINELQNNWLNYIKNKNK
ncbi:peptidase MA family metallohydrolase [Clostridium sp.]|uniref:peptidase MA family metallohydrolase n=1 Tax=Clostridium sp. TaxID=1506 RepID=UPI003F33CF48